MFNHIYKLISTNIYAQCDVIGVGWRCVASGSALGCALSKLYIYVTVPDPPWTLLSRPVFEGKQELIVERGAVRNWHLVSTTVGPLLLLVSR
jgi:hypothetical protein